MIEALFQILSDLEKIVRPVGLYLKGLISSPFLQRLESSDWSAKIKDPKNVTYKLGVFSLLLGVVSTIFGYLLTSKIGWAFQEGKPMTFLSFVFLLMIGWYMEQVWQTRAQGKKLEVKEPTTVWWFLSWGFYIAAWDELLRLHETLDRSIHKLARVAPSHITDHLDDLFVILYGVVGLRILWEYRAEVLRFANAWSYFICACICGLASVILDIACADKPLLLNFVDNQIALQNLISILDVTEECFKICAEVFFVGLAVKVLENADVAQQEELYQFEQQTSLVANA